MGRKTKEKDKRTHSIYNFGLKIEEDEKLEKYLKESDLSLRQLIRALLRQWIEAGGGGVLKSTK